MSGLSATTEDAVSGVADEAGMTDNVAGQQHAVIASEDLMQDSTAAKSTSANDEMPVGADVSETELISSETSNSSQGLSCYSNYMKQSPADAVKPARRKSMQKLLQFDVFRFISSNPEFQSLGLGLYSYTQFEIWCLPIIKFLVQITST